MVPSLAPGIDEGGERRLQPLTASFNWHMGREAGKRVDLVLIMLEGPIQTRLHGQRCRLYMLRLKTAKPSQMTKL